MADNMLEGTFSFEAGFAPQTPGFSHSPRYTYGLSVLWGPLFNGVVSSQRYLSL